MILIDTNVLVDIATRDPRWALWSLAQLEQASLYGPLLINDVVYAELSVRYNLVEELDDFLSGTEIILSPMPKAALFLAGKVFARYRKAGGTRHGGLPDFFIGAHAMVADIPLLTRDVSRYRSYFPTIALITP